MNSKNGFFGHYHGYREVNSQFVLLFQDIIPLDYKNTFNYILQNEIKNTEEGKGLSKGYTSPEELWDDLDK